MNIVEKIKRIGYIRGYECQDNNNNSTKNTWYDNRNVYYKFENNTLVINKKGYYDSEFINYLNAMPDTINIIIDMKDNTIDECNISFDSYRNNYTNKNIIINLSDNIFSSNAQIDFSNLPNNIKISSLFNKKTNHEDNNKKISYLEWNLLNKDDEEFRKQVNSMTYFSKKRICQIRKIAFDFYNYLPIYIKYSKNSIKARYAFEWCKKNIMYDFDACNSDGTIKCNREDSQNPINAYYKRIAVYEGQARLLKILLNNYYMNVPCFLVSGYQEKKSHEWNEVYLENRNILSLDFSRKKFKIKTNNIDYEINKYMIKKTKEKQPELLLNKNNIIKEY